MKYVSVHVGHFLYMFLKMWQRFYAFVFPERFLYVFEDDAQWFCAFLPFVRHSGDPFRSAMLYFLRCRLVKILMSPCLSRSEEIVDIIHTDILSTAGVLGGSSSVPNYANLTEEHNNICFTGGPLPPPRFPPAGSVGRRVGVGAHTPSKSFLCFPFADFQKYALKQYYIFEIIFRFKYVRSL